MLLWGSRSPRLRAMLPRYKFVRRSVSRFMPGEQIGDALDAAERLKQSGIPTVVTHLGENVGDAGETHKVRDHYLDVLPQIQSRGLDANISVKLTELGLDQDPELCLANMKSLLDRGAGAGAFVWIDMEGSKYTTATLDLFQRVRSEHSGVGLCLQSYLRRTMSDLEKLLPIAPVIRLVKGAYAEPPDLAFPKKSDTDDNFFSIAKKLLEQAKAKGVVPGFATHDVGLIRRIAKEAEAMGVAKSAYEVQMLYGIRTEAQLQLVREGFRVRVLISYGTFWFPWYMRRLAERPANVWFVLRNITAR